MKSKYLILDNMGSFGLTEGPIVFPEFEQHDRVASMYGGKEHVVAAGFVQVYVEKGRLKVACFGKSNSLGVESRGQLDEHMIYRMFVDPY